MKVNQTIQTLLLGAIPIALSGCASYPISKDLRDRATPVALAQVMQTPNHFRGKTVVWGGRIIKTVNTANGADIYVLRLPLTRHEKPIVPASSSGRFIAAAKRFVEPEEYKRGRLVTVAGTIAGVRTEPVQKVKYRYPVLDIEQLHLWPPPERRYYYYYPGWYWGWGAYYPGWYWGYYPAWGPAWDWSGPGWDWDEDYWGDWD